MKLHETLESRDFQRLAKIWQNEVSVFDSYLEYHSKIIDIFTQFSFMCDGYLGRVSIAMQRIEVLLNGHPAHLEP